MKDEQKSLLKNISVKTLLFSFLFLFSIGVFALLAHEVVGENEDWFDTRVFTFLKAHSSPGSIQFFKALTFLGSTWFILSAYIILVTYLLIKHQKADAINIAIIGITSFILLNVLKSVYARHRPDLPLFNALTNYSFPSGHALSSFILCSILVFLTWKSNLERKWKWLLSILLILLSVLIGVSRIVLRYHYASDVLASFCLGFAWVLLCLWLQKIFTKKNPVTE